MRTIAAMSASPVPRPVLIILVVLGLGAALAVGLAMGRRPDAEPRRTITVDGASTSATPPTTRPAPAGTASAYAFCAPCHRPDGMGMAGVFPALKGNARLIGDPLQVTAIILGGFDSHGEPGMPRWSARMAPLAHLSDATIAEALSFARTSWGNQGTVITAAHVADVRARHGRRDRPWTPADLVQVTGP